MKRIWVCTVLLLLLLCGCSVQEQNAPARFEGETLSGWNTSQEASYPLHPVSGFAENLCKTGAYYLSTGEVRPAYAVQDGTLQVQRYFPSAETENYWRGLFFTADSMTMGSGRTASAVITPEVGMLAGICVGTDRELNNGYAAMLNLATQCVELYRVNQGILTALAVYQDGVSTGAMHIELGQSYEMEVSYTETGENACRIAVRVNGKELLNTALSGYGVAQGRGQQVSLVTSDMQCSFQKVQVDGQAMDVSQLQPSVEEPWVVDGSFRGEITSQPFKINTRLLCFKAGGTKDPENMTISLVDEQTQEVLLLETGSGSEEMLRHVWNVEPYMGRKCVIRITDRSKSGHLNVDSFTAANQEPLDMQLSLLSSQVGYSNDAVKKAYIRAPQGTALSETGFTLHDFRSWETVYEGNIQALGSCWGSDWWELNFTPMQGEGTYVLAVGDGLVSTAFSIGDGVLLSETLADTSLNQLDLRRSPGKLGWRDSSTDGLRELHAQVMAVHTMLDLLEMQEGWLSDYDRARAVDNLTFGLSYILEAQERTDDPLTDGRFIHDLYPSEFTAHELRTWFDTTYAMSALARACPVLRELGQEKLAAQAKAAFDLSFEMCLRRPYYLDEEFDVEGSGGYQNVVSAMRSLYYIRDFSWEFSKELRTRDKLMFLRACTYMAQADEDPRYLEQAKIWAKEVCDAQYTDYQHPIDGAYGCFYEFENNREAMMLEWIQANNLLLGNQTPTDLLPLVDLLELAPTDPDAAMWYNTLVTYVQGYVKATGELTPLGIYPIAAYGNEEQAGVRFFQTISHGASSHFGLSARNIQLLAQFFQDSSLSELAQNNIQFQVGLNPGFPTDTSHQKWEPYSLLYLVGSRYFRGYFNGGAYIPPLGSGFNGFSASTQFTVETIDRAEDLPLGIIDKAGGYQFNEDYLPHGMGYSAGVAAIDGPVRIPIVTTRNGQPVSAQLRILGDGERSLATDADGRAELTGLAAGETVTLELSYQGTVIQKKLTAISGTARPLTVDFAQSLEMELTVPEKLRGSGEARLVLKNTGASQLQAELFLRGDGVTLDKESQTVTIQPGETVTVDLVLTAGDAQVPYLVYVYAALPNASQALTATGFVE